MLISLIIIFYCLSVGLLDVSNIVLHGFPYISASPYLTPADIRSGYAATTLARFRLFYILTHILYIHYNNETSQLLFISG